MPEAGAVWGDFGNVSDEKMVCSTSRLSRAIETLRPFVKHERFERQRGILDRRNTTRIVLENINDPHNAAACVRTAECMGVQDIHMIESYNQINIDDSVSAHSWKWVNIHRHRSAKECMAHLKELGYFVMASNLDPSAVSLDKADLAQYAPNRIAMVFGNEGRGISKLVQRSADLQYILPMAGFTQSLNVSASVAMSLYHLRISGFMTEPLSEEHKQATHITWLCRDVPAARAILERANVPLDDL